MHRSDIVLKTRIYLGYGNIVIKQLRINLPPWSMSFLDELEGVGGGGPNERSLQSAPK
jgi:hypothetical protein